MTTRVARRKALLATWCTLVMTTSGCGWYSVIPPPGSVKGWQYARQPESYDPQSLFHYMNGKARVYLDYGFVRLDHVEFATPEGKPVIDVDVYDMGSPTGAFGIYSLERGEDLPLHCKKRLGYMVGSSRFFWKGNYYVTIASADASARTIDAVNALSLRVENSLAADFARIPLLEVFPEQGLVPESEQYFAINLMGHEFMGAGFVARYEEKGNRFRVFLSPKQSPGDARGAYQKLKGALSDHGKFIAEERGIGQSGFLAQDAYLGNWLASVSGNYIVGAVGFHDVASARRLLAFLCRNLATFGVGPAES